MRRNKNSELTETPYHLCARTNERLDFGPPLERVWLHMQNYLHFSHFAYGVRVHSFVLMPNHFHLLASFPRGNLSQTMNYFMRETSRAIARDCNRSNHIYGTRVFRSEIRSFHYFMHAYKYVYRNPVEANLCDRVEGYKFSTLPSLLGLSHGMVPLAEDTLLFDDLENQLVWLNSKPDEVHRESVKRALRRQSFELPRSKRSGAVNELELMRY